MNAKSISCIVFFLNLPGKSTQNNKKGIVFIFLKGGEPSYKIADYNNGGGGGQMYWSSLLFVQGNIKRHIK